jgi:tetratricopeptide (TPR) repeat protein
MEAAVAADPDNPAYQASLAYMALAAGKSRGAKEAAEQAIGLKPDDPLLYMLQAQATAAVAEMYSEETGELIEAALRAFDDAARFDPTNALPLIQGASVAFDVEREDLALPRIKEAFERPRLVLYRLLVPFDLHPDRKPSVETWQYVQYGRWMETLARCQNVSRALLRRGEEEMAAGDLEAAEVKFREALAVARMVAMSDPNLVIATSIAINMMEDAYARLVMHAARAMVSAQFAKLHSSAAEQARYFREWWESDASGHKMDTAPRALSDPRWTFESLDSVYTWLLEREAVSAPEEKAERDRWSGEMGVLQIGRAELYGALQTYLKKVNDSPPETVRELLDLEARCVERTILGIRLTPASDREPAVPSDNEQE